MFRYNDRTTGVRSFCFNGGTAASFCKCYAKEHSFASSWFGDTSLMRTDMHNIFPADSKTNDMKSNFPLGYARAGSGLASTYNDTKIGRSDAVNNFGYWGVIDTTDNGNNNTYNKVFEPIDEFKGDFARTYLYMTTRYDDRINNWKMLNTVGQKVISNTSYTGLEPWILQLCVKWHKLDPPSNLEKKRNDSVFSIQGNRNPYIDFPSLVEKVFGTNGSGVCVPSGIKEKATAIRVAIYPNPVTGNSLTIDIDSKLSDMGVYQISDILGRKLLEQKLNQNKHLNIDITDLARGTYLLTIFDEDHFSYQKFIKE